MTRLIRRNYFFDHGQWRTCNAIACAPASLLFVFLLSLFPQSISAQDTKPSAKANDDGAERIVITADALTDEHIQLAIKAIVDELNKRKDPDHFWDPKRWVYNQHGDDAQVGGYTALCALALLSAGQSYQDPNLRDAIDYLSTNGMSGTYAIAVRAHVWAMLPQKYHPNLTADLKWLIDGFSERARGWGYTQQPSATRKDNSLRQYGALGLWEASKRGAACDQRYWRMLEDAFLECQMADGGWNYVSDSAPPRGSMTAAGLTVLYITQDLLHSEEALSLTARVETPAQRSINLGLEWMARNFSATQNPGRDADFYYYLYGIERVGLASGLRSFGTHDWYREGAAELIRRLCEWDETTRTMNVHDKVAGVRNAGDIHNGDLAFGLLFLSRGRVPIAINKLQIEGMAWNNRPRDVANLTTSIGTTTETALNWQIVNFADEPETWLDAPLVYFASNNPLPWLEDMKRDVRRIAAERETFLTQQARDEVAMDAPLPGPNIAELDQLKKYLDLGGFLFAVNEGSVRRFADSIEAAGQLMYPQYTWRDLPADHWAYTMSPVAGRRVPLKGLSNGVRDLIIISPMDLSQTFQSRKKNEPAHDQTAANIYYYASEFNTPKPRLDALGSTSKAVAPKSDAILVVRAMYDGNWNAEPLALERFNRWLMHEGSAQILTRNVPLKSLATVEPAPALVLITGIDAHEFTKEEMEAIAPYVRSGGNILFETVGGRGAFTVSAEKQFAELFNPPQPMMTGPIITGENLDGATSAKRVEYRPFALEVFGGRETTPRLRAILIDDKPRMIFSREDISNAMLDQPCWGISGYSTQSARQLMRNIVLYAQSLKTPTAE